MFCRRAPCDFPFFTHKQLTLVTLYCFYPPLPCALFILEAGSELSTRTFPLRVSSQFVFSNSSAEFFYYSLLIHLVATSLNSMAILNQFHVTQVHPLSTFSFPCCWTESPKRNRVEFQRYFNRQSDA